MIRNRRSSKDKPCIDHDKNSYSSITAMCKYYGISASLFRMRLNNGWRLQDALTIPVRKKALRGADDEINLDDVNLRFGRSMQKNRQLQKLSQKSFGKVIADEIGMEKPIPVSTISSWENGKRAIGLDAAYYVSNYFHLTIDEMIRKVDK